MVAYQLGGDVAAANCLRQLSIPLSVILGGFYLGEIQTRRRLGWAIVLAVGVLIIIVAR